MTLRPDDSGPAEREIAKRTCDLSTLKPCNRVNACNGAAESPEWNG